MRFKQHRAIARDVFEDESDNKIFAFGCIVPDYIRRHPIHICNKTFDIAMDMFFSLKDDKNAKISHLNLGQVCHYICDYCCYAHGKKYYSLLYHRIYEVRIQKYYFANREKILLWYEKYKSSNQRINNQITDKDSLCKYIREQVERLEKKNDSYNDKYWCMNKSIMKNDIKMAYILLDIMNRYWKEYM